MAPTLPGLPGLPDLPGRRDTNSLPNDVADLIREGTNFFNEIFHDHRTNNIGRFSPVNTASGYLPEIYYNDAPTRTRHADPIDMAYPRDGGFGRYPGDVQYHMFMMNFCRTQIEMQQRYLDQQQELIRLVQEYLQQQRNGNGTRRDVAPPQATGPVSGDLVDYSPRTVFAVTETDRNAFDQLADRIDAGMVDQDRYDPVKWARCRDFLKDYLRNPDRYLNASDAEKRDWPSTKYITSMIVACHIDEIRGMSKQDGGNYMKGILKKYEKVLALGDWQIENAEGDILTLSKNGRERHIIDYIGSLGDSRNAREQWHYPDQPQNL